MDSPRNRFWLRASKTNPQGIKTTLRHKPGTRWRWWIIWDAATDAGVGEISDDYEALAQQLRSLRAKHREPVETYPVWVEDRKFLP
jgi:hypothetical protein